MKRTIFILVMLLLCIGASGTRTLKIIKLNTQTIKIGKNNRLCMVGSTFEESEEIKWNLPKQDMWVKAITGSSHELMHFTHEAFVSKKAKSPMEYYNKINHPSVRADEMTILKGKNKEKFPEKRIALIVGNSNYSYLSSLNNPINDATDIAEKLQSLGFDIYVLYDVNYSDFDTALKKFSGSAKDYDVALVYFSGHGIQYDGLNYLIPVDTRLSIPDDLLSCIDLEDIYSKLNRTSCEIKLIFLDACRNEAPWSKRRESFKEQDANGIRVVFSTGPNKFSYDGNEGRNSPFAEAFLQNVDKPSPNVLSTISDISTSYKSISARMGLPEQEIHGFGSDALSFSFVDASLSPVSGELIVHDINQLKELAQNGDKRAYIHLAEYYLNNAAGITSYERAHIYAVKAIEANVDVPAAKEIIRKLTLLDFYKISDYKKPSF